MAEVSSGSTSSEKLKNVFYVIRHGESYSNVEKILVSDPAIGTKQYGLTDTGKQQAVEAAGKFKTLLSNDVSNVIIISSDFRRTRETAEILHSELQIKEPIRFEIALRERGLGKLDMTNSWDGIKQMWGLDELDPTHTENDVESVMTMALRTSRLVQSLDKENINKVIILVSHGDPSQCLHAIFMGKNPNEFRTYPGIKNCEIRQLKETNL